MAQDLRVILLNTEEQHEPSLRDAVLQFEGVRIVAEVDEPALLTQVADQLSAHALFVDLDPVPDAVLPIAGEIASAHPQLSVVAISKSTDGQLILSAIRRGLKEFLTRPIDTEMLGEILARAAEHIDDQGTQGRLISIVGAAGGVGATTLATNLAVELAELHAGTVCVVDLDYRFGHVATFLDVEPTYSIADLCETPERLEPQVIEKALVTHSSGIKVLCSPKNFAEAANITAARCIGALSGLVRLYDYVIVDGPSRFDAGAKAVFDISDHVFLLMELLVPSVRNVQRMVRGMREVGFSLDRVSVICNRLGRDSATLRVSDVESTLDVKVFAAIPDDWATVSGAVNLGEALVQSHAKSRVRNAISEIAERLHAGGDESDDTDSQKKHGLLSKIFSDA